MARINRIIRNWGSISGVVAMGLSIAAPAPGADQPPPRFGQQIEDFSLRDFRGQEHALADFAEARVVVVVFLGTECPLAKLYSRRLTALQQRYRDKQVVVVAINSNCQDGITELADYARLHKIGFPLLKDPGNRIADAFGAQRTPQAFLLDQTRTIRYAGAIDDQYGIGYQRDQPTQEYLASAIDDLLMNRPVAVPLTTAVGCQIGRIRKQDPSGDVTYAKHIAPILNRRCVECHRDGEIAPFPLARYEDVAGWEETILEVIAENRMPPWFAAPEHGEFKNDARLSDEEKRLIGEWAANGSPPGDEADLLAPPAWTAGWRMPEPDQVAPMDDKPFTVPAEGVVDYQYYVVDPQWDEDKYIVAAEARPENRAVVHHIIAYLIPPGTSPHKDHRRTMLVGYAPGSPPNILRDGLAIRAPAGSKLLFEMHYTPNGSEQQDLSYVGFKFTDLESVTQLVRGRAAINHRFAIPPQAKSHQVVAAYRAKRDELLLRMSPHMHLRGKSFRYEAVYPDDRREVLLDVPNYDFNWQLSYELAEPKLLPKGTKVICTAQYDNSPQNPANPDPDREVRWGEQSWDEMMIGFFDVVELKSQETDPPSELTAASN